MSKNVGIYWDKADGTSLSAIVNTESGFFQPFSGTGGGYNTAIAGAFSTSNWAKVTESHADAIERACIAIRPRS